MEFTHSFGSSGQRICAEGSDSSSSSSGSISISSRNNRTTDGLIWPSGVGFGDVRAHAVETAAAAATGSGIEVAAQPGPAVIPVGAEMSYLGFGAPRTERERMLWRELAKSQAEIQQLQSQIRGLLDINIRYAEQLQSAINNERPRKRSKTMDPYQHSQDQRSTIGMPLLHSQHWRRDAAQAQGVAAGAGDSHAGAVHRQLQQHHSNYIAARQAPVTTRNVQLGGPATNNKHRSQADAKTLHVLASTETLYQPTERTASGVIGRAPPSVADAFGTHGGASAAIARSSDVSPRLPISNMFILDIASPSDQQQMPASLQERSTAPLQAEMPLVTSAPPVSSAPPISSALATPQPTDRRILHRGSSAPKDGTYAGGSSSGRAKREQQTRTATDIAEIAVGDAEEIPSIGKFDLPRTLYVFKERVREFELTHGSQWREKMDSRRRQNWSRISAVYNRIIQLRGPSTATADVERAITQIEREMAESKVTLTRYSQLVRKQLNNERRQSIHQGDGRTSKLEGET